MKNKDIIGYEVHTLDNMIGRLISSYRAPLESQTGTSTIQSWIASFLNNNPHRDIFQKDIEAEFRITRSTVTGILQSMEKNQLITREAVPTDARLKRLVLTDKGRALHNASIQILTTIENQLVRDVSEEELSMFIHVLRKIRTNVETDEHYPK